MSTLYSVWRGPKACWSPGLLRGDGIPSEIHTDQESNKKVRIPSVAAVVTFCWESYLYSRAHRDRELRLQRTHRLIMENGRSPKFLTRTAITKSLAPTAFSSERCISNGLSRSTGSMVLNTLVAILNGPSRGQEHPAGGEQRGFHPARVTVGLSFFGPRLYEF